MDFVIYPGTFFLLVTSILLIQIFCFIESERDSRSLKKGTYQDYRNLEWNASLIIILPLAKSQIDNEFFPKNNDPLFSQSVQSLDPIKHSCLISK